MIIVSLSIFLQESKCCDLFLSQTVLSVCLLLINRIKEFREFQPRNTVTAYHKPHSDCVFQSARSVSNNKLAPSEIVYCTAVKVVPKTPYFALPSPTGTVFSTSKQRLPKLLLHHILSSPRLSTYHHLLHLSSFSSYPWAFSYACSCFQGG